MAHPAARRLNGWYLIFAGVLPCILVPQQAFPTGIYENQSRLAYFLRAPVAPAMDGHATATRGADHDAAIFEVDAAYPVRTRILLQGELSYASFISNDEIDDAIADFVLRAKVPVFPALDQSILVLGAMRTGSGVNDLFPYSTGSTDLEIGAAIVDTVSAFTWWGRATAVYVTRVDDTLKDLHENYATAGGGIVLGLGAFDVQGGMSSYFFRSGGSRFVYFADGTLQYTPSTEFYAFIQGEFGKTEDRAIDFAAGMGIRVNI